jgi:penicillin-binding protein 2
VLSLAFLVLAGRLYQLQILRGDEYKGRADENFVKELRVPADRGLMLDRNRRVLVDSRPSYDVALIPYFCGKQCGEVVARLATMLSLSREEENRVRDHLKRSRGLERFRPFTVKVDIGRDDLACSRRTTWSCRRWRSSPIPTGTPRGLGQPFSAT